MYALQDARIYPCVVLQSARCTLVKTCETVMFVPQIPNIFDIVGNNFDTSPKQRGKRSTKTKVTAPQDYVGFNKKRTIMVHNYLRIVCEVGFLYMAGCPWDQHVTDGKYYFRASPSTELTIDTHLHLYLRIKSELSNWEACVLPNRTTNSSSDQSNLRS